MHSRSLLDLLDEQYFYAFEHSTADRVVKPARTIYLMSFRRTVRPPLVEKSSTVSERVEAKGKCL